MNTPFNFPWALAYLQKHGQSRYGAHFKIHECDHDTIYKLFVYFLRLESEATRLNINLSKGILLAGPIGCGKSSLMTLMNSVPSPDRRFTLRPCRDITFEFHEKGYKVIARYSTLSYKDTTPRTYCFDDLGIEQNLKHFGNDCNVMGEILLSRYDLFIADRMLTHITTNLSATELETHYGNRIRSRLREQLNLLTFPPNSPDKRI